MLLAAVVGTFLNDKSWTVGEEEKSAFNQTVDELYDRVQEGKVYTVSKAKVNLAKKKFSNLPNEYELTLERNTEIVEVGLRH